jgi:hypothetical protein
MSDKTKTQYSVEELKDGMTMPGITQLLNPKAMKTFDPANTSTPATKAQEQREISVTFDEDDAPPLVTKTSTAQLTSSALNAVPQNSTPLAALGVQYELHFESQHGNFRYTRMKPHAKASFELWQQKFFFQMKIDLKALEIQVSFQEFSKKQSPFHEDAFGLVDASYVQIVRLENDTQKIFVLLSTQSLLLKQDEVRAALAGKSFDKDGSDDLKIELAS